jgi:S-DNA-T family DNA segregation ATPase FtsK/SpoIIIE
MARGGKKRQQESSDFDLRETLNSEVLRGVWSVLCLLGTIFFGLAALGYAGKVGDVTYSSLSYLLGVGYFLIPIVFMGLGISFLRSLHETLGIAKWIGAGLFFVSGLGVIEILFERGGLLGTLLAAPLLSLFEKVASILILIAILAISVILVLELKLATLSFSWIRNLFKRAEEPLEPPDPTLIEPGETVEENQDEKDSGGGNTKAEPLQERSRETEFDRGDANIPSLPTFAPIRGSAYEAPPLSILEKDRGKPGQGDVKANANLIKRTLQNFGITVEIDEISIGPTVTRYALKPAEGVRLSKIISLQTNLELALAAHPVRIEAPIPGRSLVGIEVPNSAKTTVGLATLLGNDSFQKSDKALLMALGKDITGQAHFADLSKMPHLLIAGTTGSGKSVTIHTLITSLLFRNSPEMMRFIMIDPKRVELTLWGGIPHLMSPVVTDAKKAILALKWAAKEMDRRYNILEAESVRDISSYHKNVLQPALERGPTEGKDMPVAMPYVVIVIDELADIMQTYPRELEAAIVRLAQMSRAVGIHLVLSTQRPSVNVITGLIKANIPARIALQVSSQIDSRTILDTGGAEKLLGAGDMLYLSGDMSKPSRLQSAYISETELKRVREYIIKNNEPELTEDITLLGGEDKNVLFDASLESEAGDDDDLYEEAKTIVSRAGKASTSYLQRKLRVGYARAARLMDILEERGVIGPADGSKPREVLERAPEGFGRDEDDAAFEEVENAPETSERV